MAASILPVPGTKLGPCKAKCKHIDCAETRAIAAEPCRFCNKPLGFGSAWFKSALFGCVAHRHCLEDAVERNDARVGMF